MPKRLFFAIFASLAIVFAPAQAQAQDPLRIAAVVNDDIISIYDLGARIALTASTSGLPSTSETANRLAPRVLQTLIDERLKRQEAERRGISVDPSEVQDGINRIERRNGLPPGGIEQFLAEKGLKKETLVDQIEGEIIWVKVVNALIRPTIKIDNDEIDQAVESIQQNAGKPEYRLFEIFLSVANETQAGDARAFADRLIEQIRAGAPFQGLARSFSSAASAKSGGDMGWLGMQQIDSEMRPIVAGLQPGEVSKPFPTLGGYRILMLQDTRTAQGLTEDMGSVTLEQVFLPLTPNANADEIARQSAAATQLTSGTDSCEAMREAGLRTASPLSGSLGKVQVKNLPPTIADAVSSLDVFTPSAPIRVEGGVAVLMVCEREDASDGLQATRNAIRRQLTNQRMTIKAEKLLRDLRRAAFLDVRL